MKPLNMGRYLVGVTVGSLCVLAFQNCVPQSGFQTDQGTFSSQSSMGSSNGSNNLGRTGIVQTSGTDTSNSGGLYAPPKQLFFTDLSVGDGSTIQRVKQTLIGVGGPNLRGCTALLSESHIYCVKDTDYRLVGGAGDKQWSYNAGTDTYSADFTVSGWPHADYITRYILPDGTRSEVRFRPILFRDSSSGNGSYLTRVVQVLSGVGGAGLRGCTALMSNYNVYCLKDSEFRVVGGSDDKQWSYNPSTDTYSANFDVTNWGWPHQEYFTRYILPNGNRLEIRFYPGRTYTAGPAPYSGPKWVMTVEKACLGPTPAPAPIGQACSVRGQTLSNACGTATCQ
ncbi:hypothetical protein AZI87_17020 [Bdellovibrio bacteriovorus]|uniref:Secreted protein n=1 Tax=Bdellovibrio bacteriovorus TaxID=959 RepID=A0A162G0L0_BDEBC|nr:hypothetical protein [Bdellovibrio bacteriovorus]KYG62962.1 hypothetical protein AZI87_17020 [Bdellovibrio bacteriovorus]